MIVYVVNLKLDLGKRIRKKFNGVLKRKIGWFFLIRMILFLNDLFWLILRDILIYFFSKLNVL